MVFFILSQIFLPYILYGLENSPPLMAAAVLQAQAAFGFDSKFGRKSQFWKVKLPGLNVGCSGTSRYALAAAELGLAIGCAMSKLCVRVCVLVRAHMDTCSGDVKGYLSTDEQHKSECLIVRDNY